MKLFVLPLVILSLAISGECDLAKVENGFYCADCEDVRLPADLVSDVVYYACGDCGVFAESRGNCDDCEKPMSKRTSDRDVCADCFGKPEAVELCVKISYECPDCGGQAADDGECGDCEVALAKRASRALVGYECPECGTWERQPGKCEDGACSKKGAELARICSRSGDFPHGGEPN